MYKIAVKENFSAAHNLRDYKGKCEKLHGHNWTIEAAVSSKTLGKNGLLIDFKILKERLKKVLNGLDHTYLNEVPFFKKKNPTSENIARFIFEKLKRDGIRPQRVTVWESEDCCATYSEK